LCERSQFKDGDGKWRSALEDDFIKWVGMAYITYEDLEGARESWVNQVAAYQLNAKPYGKRQLRQNRRCIRMRHKPPEGKKEIKKEVVDHTVHKM
jgi:hypothetical protein